MSMDYSFICAYYLELEGIQRLVEVLIEYGDQMNDKVSA